MSVKYMYVDTCISFFYIHLYLFKTMRYHADCSKSIEDSRFSPAFCLYVFLTPFPTSAKPSPHSLQHTYLLNPRLHYRSLKTGNSHFCEKQAQQVRVQYLFTVSFVFSPKIIQSKFCVQKLPFSSHFSVVMLFEIQLGEIQFLFHFRGFLPFLLILVLGFEVIVVLSVKHSCSSQKSAVPKADVPSHPLSRSHAPSFPPTLQVTMLISLWFPPSCFFLHKRVDVHVCYNPFFLTTKSSMLHCFLSVLLLYLAFFSQHYGNRSMLVYRIFLIF